MSNSRSPRAVRSITIGTRGMPRGIAGRSVRRPRRTGRGEGGRARARCAWRGVCGPCAASRRVGRRSAIHEHRQHCEVVGLDAVRRGVELGTRERRQRGPAAGDQPDGLEQLHRRRRLVDQAVGAGHAREQLELGIRHCRVEHDMRCGALRLEPPAHRDPVAVEQSVLEQHDVGPFAGEQRGAVGGAGGGADGHHARLGSQQHHQPRTDGRLRVHDGNAGHARNPSSAPSIQSKTERSAGSRTLPVDEATRRDRGVGPICPRARRRGRPRARRGGLAAGRRRVRGHAVRRARAGRRGVPAAGARGDRAVGDLAPARALASGGGPPPGRCVRRRARADELVDLRVDGPDPARGRGHDRVRRPAARGGARLAPPARRRCGSHWRRPGSCCSRTRAAARSTPPASLFALVAAACWMAYIHSRPAHRTRVPRRHGARARDGRRRAGRAARGPRAGRRRAFPAGPAGAPRSRGARLVGAALLARARGAAAAPGGASSASSCRSSRPSPRSPASSCSGRSSAHASWPRSRWSWWRARELPRSAGGNPRCAAVRCDPRASRASRRACRSARRTRAPGAARPASRAGRRRRCAGGSSRGSPGVRRRTRRR